MSWVESTHFLGGKNSRARTIGLSVFLAVVTLGICTGVARVAKAAADSKTTQDGVYTDEQAARGKAQYSQTCSGCHMDDLSGSGQALPLAGEAFTQVWEGQSVFDLFDLVHSTMPQDRPGTLTDQTAIDIITYLLKYNGYPAGKDELKDDPDTLKSIRIVSKKSAQ